MLPQNKRHIRSVALWGGGASVLLAGASLVKFSPLVAASILMGAVLSLANIYSIVLVAESLTAAARAGHGPGGGARAITAVIYVLKLAVITAVLALLVIYRLANLIALLAGFTAVLISHVLVGLGRFTAEHGEDV